MGVAGRKLRQPNSRDWPRGVALPVAVIGLEPHDIEKRCGLRFSESFDDLDRLVGAIGETRDGRTFALVRHLGAPSPGTEIWVDEESDDPATELAGVLETLELGEADLSWIAPIAARSARPRAGGA